MCGGIFGFCLGLVFGFYLGVGSFGVFWGLFPPSSIWFADWFLFVCLGGFFLGWVVVFPQHLGSATRLPDTTNKADNSSGEEKK